MKQAAKDLDFFTAAQLRDELMATLRKNSAANHFNFIDFH